METSRTFGEGQKFAIHYRGISDLENANNEKMAFCHLVVDGVLIGQADEECYLPTWISKIISIARRIEEEKYQLFPIEFHGLADREIFQSILKSNQVADEFHADFLYLPQMEVDIWKRHIFSVDETMDNYQVCFYIKEGQLTFLIDRSVECSGRDFSNDEFRSMTVPLELFLNIIDEATDFLTTRYQLMKDGFK